MSLVICSPKTIIFTSIIRIEQLTDGSILIECLHNNGRISTYNITDSSYKLTIENIREKIRRVNNINNNEPFHLLSSLPTIFIDNTATVSVKEHYTDSSGNKIINRIN